MDTWKQPTPSRTLISPPPPLNSQTTRAVKDPGRYSRIHVAFCEAAAASVQPWSSDTSLSLSRGRLPGASASLSAARPRRLRTVTVTAVITGRAGLPEFFVHIFKVAAGLAHWQLAKTGWPRG